MPNTILVVDDEKNIVQLARLYLGNEGFKVEEAYDGKQALEKARSVNPDLVILDVMMPEMDGLTVCKELRKTSSVPVIILTARGDDAAEGIDDEYLLTGVLLDERVADLHRCGALHFEEGGVQRHELCEEADALAGVAFLLLPQEVHGGKTGQEDG